MRSETRATTTVEIAVSRPRAYRYSQMHVLTSCRSCYSVGNYSPQLDFVGVGCNLQIVDNRRELHTVSTKLRNPQY